MASGKGWTAQLYREDVHQERVDILIRQLYWIRYIDWMISSPLIIFALTTLAGLPGIETFFAIISDIALILLVRNPRVFQNVNDRCGLMH
jgi:bacteriorhodopsin